MTSLIATSPAEVARAPEMRAAEGFSQSSTRVEKPSEAPPAAANVAQTTVAAPVVTPPVDTEAKPPPPTAADGSTAAGSPADSCAKCDADACYRHQVEQDGEEYRMDVPPSLTADDVGPERIPRTIIIIIAARAVPRII